ncbi:MAG: AtpZ/AtpI family protein [Tenacibaculum sp.]
MSKKQLKKQPNKKYFVFSGIALQMGITVYLGNLLGKWLDLKHQNNNQFYLKICTLIAVFIAILSVIYQANKLFKNDK